MLCKFCASLALCVSAPIWRFNFELRLLSPSTLRIQLFSFYFSNCVYVHHIEIDSTFEWFPFHCFCFVSFHVSLEFLLFLRCCWEVFRKIVNFVGNAFARESAMRIHNITSKKTLKFVLLLLFFVYLFYIYFRFPYRTRAPTSDRMVIKQYKSSYAAENFNAKIAQLVFY